MNIVRDWLENNERFPERFEIEPSHVIARMPGVLFASSVVKSQEQFAGLQRAFTELIVKFV